MDEQIVNEVAAKLSLVYSFAMMGAYNLFHPHDLGTGAELTVTELHTLTMIAEHPGLCVSDVAHMWNRTPGAASRNVDRLQQRGYIEKRKLPGNQKTIRLFPTEEGLRLAGLSREADLERIRRVMEPMLERHTMEEIRTFFDVLTDANELIGMIWAPRAGADHEERTNL